MIWKVFWPTFLEIAVRTVCISFWKFLKRNRFWKYLLFVKIWILEIYAEIFLKIHCGLLKIAWVFIMGFSPVSVTSYVIKQLISLGLAFSFVRDNNAWLFIYEGWDEIIEIKVFYAIKVKFSVILPNSKWNNSWPTFLMKSNSIESRVKQVSSGAWM